MKKPDVFVITGPTASGKSALAVSLAKRLDTEIISADSRQIYKGIPIATAVPTIEEMDGIKHHLIEKIPLEAYYSASLFSEEASELIQSIGQSKGSVIVCGGSMLYLDALFKGIDDLPTVPEEIRTNLSKEWTQNGDCWLLKQLEILDPIYYEKVDRKNLKRVFHAVEISITARKPYSSLLNQKDETNLKDLPYNLIKVSLSGKRDILFNRINTRVLRMMETGLEEEALRVYPMRHLNSTNTVGLKEMFAYFDGKLTREEAIARLQKNTRVYAKKQITWHKRDNLLSYLDFEEDIDRNTEKILELKSLNIV